MSEEHGKFVWYELMTTDMEAAAAFYGAVVGWTVKAMDVEGMAYSIFEMPGHAMGVGGLMELPEEQRKQGIPPNWCGYVAVDDVDAAAKDFAANGGKVCRAPEDIPEIGRFAVVADPHGAVILLFKSLPMENLPPEPAMGTPGFVGWNELYAGNGEEAFAFYSKMFGWSKGEGMDMGAMGTYQIFEHGGVAIGGMMTKTADMPAPFWTFYFNVDAIDAAAERVKAGGGQVVNGPMEVPGGAWIIQCVDPQGAFFCLVAMKR